MSEYLAESLKSISNALAKFEASMLKKYTPIEVEADWDGDEYIGFFRVEGRWRVCYVADDDAVPVPIESLPIDQRIKLCQSEELFSSIDRQLSDAQSEISDRAQLGAASLHGWLGANGCSD